MADEKDAGGKLPEELFSELFSEMAKPVEQEVGAAPETKVEAAAAPAPETKVEAAAAPAPETKVEAAAAPAPVTAQPDHTAKLIQQNQSLVEGVQGLLKQQAQMMDRLLKENKPELTPEQRRVQVEAALTQLNDDPEGTIRRIAREEAKSQTDASVATLRDPDAEGVKQARQAMAQVYAAPDGTILRKEMSDPAFFTEMVSPETQAKVMKELYPGTPVENLRGDRAYYLDLYHATKQAQAQRQATSSAPAAAAAQAQRDIISGHGEPPKAGAGKGTGTAAKPAPDAEFKAAVVGATGSFNDAARGAQWAGRR